MQRRRAIQVMTIAGISAVSGYPSYASDPLIKRKILSTGDAIPVIGMGSWLTFDVGGSSSGESNMQHVLKRFYDLGGRVIDSSPMYGSSEEVLGKLSRKLGIEDKLWVSTKVWTNGKSSGLRQITNSQQYFSDNIKVHHIHNIRDFKTHYASLLDEKEKGNLKYLGVTHYVNGAHDDLIQVLRNYKLDFVQFNYNIENPYAEKYLIPFAADNQVATIVNRPFQTGRLFDMVGNANLPGWARVMGIQSWAAFMLKYIISNPNITATIPATTQVTHVEENMAAGKGYLPNEEERRQMKKYFDSIT